MNPLLSEFNTPFQTPPFDQIKLEHFKPALLDLMGMAKEEIENIAGNQDTPDFSNTIVALEGSSRRLFEVAEIFFNLNSAETNDEMQALAVELSPMLTDFSNEIMQNERLFARVKKVRDTVLQEELTTEEAMLLEKTYKGFVRSGAELEGDTKRRFNEISKELSKLSLKFSENLLAETNGYELHVENEEELSGLPQNIMEAATQLAKEAGKEGGWLFNLHAPSFVPFMEYADNRDLREKIFKAYSSRSFKGDKLDNQQIVLETIRLRAELASLLGYTSFADYTLEERMAEQPKKVSAFLEELFERSYGKAKKEVEEIKDFIKEIGHDIELQRWDWAYYSQKLKNKRFDLNDEMLRPYFKLENALDGIFEVAGRLFGLTFKQDKQIPVYHPDVVAYEVTDEEGRHVAVFYADFFPRKGKRGGAWMTSFRGQWKDTIDHRPVVSIVCNFTPRTETKPSLLTFNEVSTLFHEFGHALHGMLANGTYGSLSGTSVYWDFVELPSQIMENWLEEKECLDIFARHYETDEPIPVELVQKIKDSSKYHAAYQTLRQLSFGMLDMAWHTLDSTDAGGVGAVSDFEATAIAKTDLFKKIPGTCLSTQFAHIFHGGYAAGYYSYKWAEVLDADAFSLFKQRGIFDEDTAKSFKDNILSKGGSEHPMELYKKFRGQEPTIDALLERSGLS